MPLFKKNQRYKVSKRSDYIQNVVLLDGNQMECNMSMESPASGCLENVLQRMDIREMELFGLKYVSRSGQFTWVDPDRPLRRQLDKNAESQLVYLGVLHYIERAYAFRDDATRFQFFLQLKSDVIEGRIVCSLEQAILLASYALQAEYQDYDNARQSEEYVRDIERLDTTLLPRTIAGDYDRTAHADIAQHVVSSHMSLAGLTQAQAEMAYIKLTEQNEGYGIEYLKAVADTGDEVYIGNSPSGIVIRRPDGHIKQDFKRSQIDELSCNKKQFCVNVIGNKKLSAKFVLDDMETAKYVYKHSMLQHNFHLQSHEKMLYSDSELDMAGETSIQTKPSRIMHMPQPSISEQNGNLQEKAVDVGSSFITADTTVPDASINLDDSTEIKEGEQQTDGQYDTMNIYHQVPQQQVYDQSQLYVPPLANSNGGSTDALVPAIHLPNAQWPGCGTSESDYGGSSLALETQTPMRIPSYRPSPDYETIMKERAMHGPQAFAPQPLMSENVARDNPVMSVSQPDISETEPLYANIQQYVHQVTKQVGQTAEQDLPPPPPYINKSTPDLMSELGHNNHSTPQPPYPGERAPDITRHYPPSINVPPSPDVVSRRHLPNPDQIDQFNYHHHHHQQQQQQQLQQLQQQQKRPIITQQGLYKSFENLAIVDDAPSYHSNSTVSSRQNSAREECSSPETYRVMGRTMSDAAVQVNTTQQQQQQQQPQLRMSSAQKKSPTDERVDMLEAKLRSEEAVAEYDAILKKRNPFDCRAALRSENAARNRFPNVIPYEDTRVRLQQTPSNSAGYINASHIQMQVGNERLTYIATQNPLLDTVLDFWQMIWLHEVSVIVMATDLEERNTSKCPRYWPNACGVSNAVTVADMKVISQHSASSPNFTTSRLKVIRSGSKETRTVWHIQYTDWHQNGCPNDVHGFLALLDELNSVRLHMQMKKMKTSSSVPSVLVHCSTGVGRTGVVILSDVMRKCLEHNENISVSDTLNVLRQQRMYMVSKVAQYKFVHDVLIQYLKGGRLI